MWKMRKPDHLHNVVQDVEAFLHRLKLKGKGSLIWHGKELNGNFNLRLKQDGSMLMTFASRTSLQRELRQQNKKRSTQFERFSKKYVSSEPYRMRGVCENRWKIEIDRMYSRYSYNRKYFILVPRGNVVIRVAKLKLPPDSFAYGILNLFRENAFEESFTVGSTIALMKSLVDPDDALKRLEKRSLRSIITHLMVVENLRKIGCTEFANNFCWLLSFAENNLVIPVCCFKYARRRLIQVEFWCSREVNIDRGVSTALFPNFTYDDELRRYLNECFASFVGYAKQLDLPAFIYTSLSAQSATPTTRIAIRLIALLMICNNYLEYCGRKRPQAIFDFVPLLRTLNKEIQFLNAQDLKSLEGFRSQVRNALFHTGQIKNLSLDQKLLISQVLESLTQRLFLRILGFKGKFKDSLGVSREFSSIHLRDSHAAYS